MYALVDCNNFYVSCERVFNPLLNGRPVVVLSNNDGCIISRSDEAKALGIRMGQPAFLIPDIIKAHDIAVYSSNYTLYGDMSQRVMTELSRFSPNIEPYSIDEAFVDLKGIVTKSFHSYGMQIRKAVLKHLAMPTCIGIAFTKTLAKIANKLATRGSAKGSIYVIDTEEKRVDALKSTPIEKVWGVGGQFAQFLQDHHIFTAYDLSVANDAWVKKYMSVVGLRMKKELQGIPSIALETEQEDKKNIATTRSFGAMQTELGPISEAVASFAAACAMKLRRQHTCANEMTVFLHTNQFRKEDKQYAKNRKVKFPVATNSTIELIGYAEHALKDIYRKGFNYKKAGVIVSGLVPETQVTAGIFDKTDRKKENKLMNTIDSLNLSYGREKVRIAAQGTERKWKLRQERLSKCYTTNWNQLLEILSPG